MELWRDYTGQKDEEKVQNQFLSSWSDINVKKMKTEINLIRFRILWNDECFPLFGITRHAMHVMNSCTRIHKNHWLLFLERKETSLLLTDVIKVYQCQLKGFLWVFLVPSICFLAFISKKESQRLSENSIKLQKEWTVIWWLRNDHSR